MRTIETMRIEGQTVALPDWANWLAKDADGTWCVYESKPDQGRILAAWSPVDTTWCSIIRGERCPGWRDEIYELFWEYEYV